MHVKETIGELLLSPKTKLLITIVDTGVLEKIDIRTNFLNFDGVWLPTKKGVSFKKSELPIIKNLLNNIVID